MKLLGIRTVISVALFCVMTVQASISVKVNGLSQTAVTANADYSTPLVGVNVTLSEAWAGPGALTVPIKVSVKEKPALNAHDYVGMSQSSMDDNTAWDTELTIPAGQTSASLSLWMYANRGTVDTENGLLVEVDANRMDAAARAFFMDNFIPATVVVNRSTPEITADLAPITAEANTPQEVTINVRDAYGEMRDPCRYTVYWSRSGGVSASDFVVIPSLAATASGDLTFNVTYLQKGDYISRFYVENQDGKKSDPLAQNASVSVSVKAQKVVEATTLQIKFPEDVFHDQEIVTLYFGAEGFSMPNGETRGYVFFVPRDENASNLVNCVALNIDDDHRWMAGYPVYAGETSVGPFLMTLLDGSSKGVTMGYNIIVRTAQNWDEGNIVSRWNSKGFSFGVTNVVPTVTQVSMGDTCLSVSGGTMGANAILGVSKSFSARTSEPSDIDLHADQDNNYQDHTKAFTTEWTFDYGNGVPDVRYVYGPPSTPLSYVFTQSGSCTVTVRMCDKDMDHNRAVWGPMFTFKVNVYGNPTVTLAPDAGISSFTESSIGATYGRVNVALSMPPSTPITVHLDVRRVDEDNGNYPLPVLNTYDVEFDGNNTNAYVYFKSLDGTPWSGILGYIISAAVTNTTLAADGVAWKDLYQPGQLPITVVNEAPQIGAPQIGEYPVTNELVRVKNQKFSVTYTVQDVPADLANPGLTATWITSEGFFTNYQISAIGTGAYATYIGQSPEFSFSTSGSHTLKLYVEDKDGGVSSFVTWHYFVPVPPPTPPNDVTIRDGEKTLIVDGTWITDTFGLSASWVSEHSTAVNSLMTGEAANGRKVWECYVLGLDPEKTDDFKITSFPMNADGTPDLAHLVFDPPQANWNVRDARPVVKGATSPDAGEWQTVTEENKATFRFFKICVELP